MYAYMAEEDEKNLSISSSSSTTYENDAFFKYDKNNEESTIPLTSSPSSSSSSSSSTKSNKEKSPMNYIGAIAIVLYGTTSLAQTIFNKKVLATYPLMTSSPGATSSSSYMTSSPHHQNWNWPNRDMNLRHPICLCCYRWWCHHYRSS